MLVQQSDGASRRLAWCPAACESGERGGFGAEPSPKLRVPRDDAALAERIQRGALGQLSETASTVPRQLLGGGFAATLVLVACGVLHARGIGSSSSSAYPSNGGSVG